MVALLVLLVLLGTDNQLVSGITKAFIVLLMLLQVLLMVLLVLPRKRLCAAK